MKNAIATFIKEHPFLTYFIITEGYSMVRNTIIGVSQAITGNYPPESPKGNVDINVNNSEVVDEETCEEPTEEVEGDISETDSFLD